MGGPIVIDSADSEGRTSRAVSGRQNRASFSDDHEDLYLRKVAQLWKEKQIISFTGTSTDSPISAAQMWRWRWRSTDNSAPKSIPLSSIFDPLISLREDEGSSEDVMTIVEQFKSRPDFLTSMDSRQRVSRACDPCKLRKVKCNGQQRCQQCEHLNLKCAYSAVPAKKRVQGKRGHVISKYKETSASNGSGSTPISPGDVSSNGDGTSPAVYWSGRVLTGLRNSAASKSDVVWYFAS